MAGRPQQVERTIVHPSGLRHVQAFYLPRVRNASIDGLYTFVVDVTARVEAELALREARAARAAARERQRIADELHNMVIQRLFAAGLAANLPTEVTPARLRSVQDGISAALADLEAALGALPEPGGAPDLLPALARLVGAEAEPHGIAAAIENVGSVDYVPRTLAAEVLAAAREALADAVRRPGARSITVTIAADADEVRLRVAGESGESVFDWRAPVA
jgi:signal transduction histidine kinase